MEIWRFFKFEGEIDKNLVEFEEESDQNDNLAKFQT